MVRAVMYCTVRARGAEKFSRSARARTGEKVHKSSRILHALLKKTCKTGGCLLKISPCERVGADFCCTYPSLWADIGAFIGTQ